MRYRPTLLLAALLSYACGNPDRLLRPTDSKKMGGEECVDSGPIYPGCLAESTSMDTPNDIAQFEGQADGSEPLWTGSTNYDALVGPLVCPNPARGTKVAKVIDRTGEIAVFKVGDLAKIDDLPAQVNGQPEALYMIPHGYYVSTDGKWEMYGGVVKARCRIIITMTVTFIRAAVGRVDFYNADDLTVYRRADNGSDGGGTNRGWAYQDEYGNITGVSETDTWGTDGSDPTIVVTTWAGRRVCAEGWDVWINGEQVCSANGS